MGAGPLGYNLVVLKSDRPQWLSNEGYIAAVPRQLMGIPILCQSVARPQRQRCKKVARKT
jgi:hypothetical protein